MTRLGLIAGGGGLPLEIASACRAEGRPLFVARLRGAADPALQAFEGVDTGLAEFGRITRALRGFRAERVCFAGKVEKPDFGALKPDFLALRHLPSVIAASGRGDDALLRAILAAFEREGFRIEGVGEAGRGLALRPGPIGGVSPSPEDLADARVGVEAAREVGMTDRGQGAVVRSGDVVDRERWDGTDAMLVRCAETFAGGGPTGVLVKVPKPFQDMRVDLPTIGVSTIERAAAAGLRGVAGPAGQVLVVDVEGVRAAADRLGLFVLGLTGAGDAP